MLNMRLRKLAGLGAVALLAVAGVAFAACNNGSDDETAVADTAAHVEDDGAAHGEVDGAAHEEDTAPVEGAEHEADGGADPSAYLEAAPKDSLYLVQMTNFAFAPSVLEVNAGEVLEIAVQNVETLLHDFTIDRIDADVHVSYLEGTGMHGHATPENQADVHFALSEPGSGVVHLKANEPGEYVFYCTVPGHREAGMEGTLIVR